jgi:hypothetical protein
MPVSRLQSQLQIFQVIIEIEECRAPDGMTHADGEYHIQFPTEHEDFKPIVMHFSWAESIYWTCLGDPEKIGTREAVFL